ncbi:DUF4190 domain-containing protein [Microbacterium sp. NPDC090007]|uniref:DUF4190 domain-containing protein n=1 Tax=Microbacterium sp. NPDC090007 TaxID=3364204 RepID=UPI0038024477
MSDDRTTDPSQPTPQADTSGTEAETPISSRGSIPDTAPGTPAAPAPTDRVSDAPAPPTHPVADAPAPPTHPVADAPAPPTHPVADAPAPPSGYGAPAHGTPIYGAPANGASASGAPTYGTPAYGTPAYGAPASGAPTYGAPAYGAPAFGTPASGTPAFGGAPAYGHADVADTAGGYGYAMPARINTLAIVSLIASVVGVFALPVIGQIVGIVTGHMSLSQIKARAEKGRGLAIAGLIVGYVTIALGVLLLILFVALLQAAIAGSGTAYRI